MDRPLHPMSGVEDTQMRPAAVHGRPTEDMDLLHRTVVDRPAASLQLRLYRKLKLGCSPETHPTVPIPVSLVRRFEELPTPRTLLEH